MEDLINIIEGAFPGADVIGVRLLSGGMSTQMHVIDLVTATGERKRAVIRRHGPDVVDAEVRLRTERNVLNLVCNRGVLAPQPLFFELAASDVSRPSLGLSFIEGEMALSPVSPTHYAAQLAACLAGLHAVPLGGGMEAQLRSVCLRPPSASSHIPWLPNVLQPDVVSARLNSAPSHGSNPSVLLHQDPWPGNTLINDAGDITGIIDWEDASLGDPLADVAIARVELSILFGPAVCDAFTQNYVGQADLKWGGLPMWDLWAWLRLVGLIGADLEAWVAFYPLHGRGDVTKERYGRALEVFADGALDLLY